MKVLSVEADTYPFALIYLNSALDKKFTCYKEYPDLEIDRLYNTSHKNLVRQDILAWAFCINRCGVWVIRTLIGCQPDTAKVLRAYIAGTLNNTKGDIDYENKNYCE